MCSDTSKWAIIMTRSQIHTKTKQKTQKSKKKVVIKKNYIVREIITDNDIAFFNMKQKSCKKKTKNRLIENPQKPF